ncbi:hypothetical protein SZ47_04615 [Brachyspira hyodysenteriae]|uniref:Uncharacterized protein n=2 Tax=Brachyspira hyodysenteriae TaxID=159 RepID=A0A3B6VZT4_BRAHO|nr:DUF2971 domain-containing protein [Brachyspira hyodysenteriae]ANN64348.1 hypothetical protein BHYOB78_10850 [Brachyspira hyodysenteriae ATCC 27164]KLI27582.1 hypothetical protein SZ47_04615 [Brachyspira hyodysenteriae]TVL72209.1 hypothetical protein A9X74_06165 [Brachyspira hyodysenteriae]TVL76540.1 hypothetical protein A9X81_05330 [Brachyspira hyodysenteriae]TVL85258.1 hypothetical protein A9X80_07115 [Brachyspira hyodysenteriae]
MHNFYICKAISNYNNYSEALPYFNKALEYLDSIYDKSDIVYKKLYIRTLFERGKFYSFHYKFKMALKDFFQAINIFETNNIIDTNLLYNIYCSIGLEYSSINKINKANKYYNKAINLAEDFSKAYALKGNLYYKKKLYEKALKYYNISIRKGYFKSYYDKSLIYFLKKNYKKALEMIEIYFTNQIDNDKMNCICYYHRGLYKCFLNNYQDGYNDFLEGLKMYNSSTKILFDIIMIIYKNSNEEFKNIFDELLKIIFIEDFKLKNNNYIIDNNLLYKYKKIDINLLKLISNNNNKVNNIRLSNFNYFNDPADPLIKLNKEAFEAIEEYTNDIKIYSLSSEYNNFLMWSHYANEHKGICVAYDISNINEYNNMILKKVRYTNSVVLGEYEHIFDNYALNLESYFISLFYLKHKNWQYENEYRIIANTKEEYIYLPIKAIYFGMNSSDDDIKLIKSLVKDDTIKFYKMKSDENNLFNLIAEKI